MQTIVFGPVISRRFGRSLGIDLSPSKKQCNFNCLYCELKASRTMTFMQEVIELNVVIDAIKQALLKHSKVDVLTFTSNGEPTLYPHLKELITSVNDFKPAYIKTLILSNGSMFWQDEVRDALSEFDKVKFSLDSVLSSTFLRIDKPHRELKLSQILQGIYDFAQDFSKLDNKELIAEVLVLKGINDTKEDALAIVEFLNTIPLTRLDISTLDRPGAYKQAKALNEGELRLYRSYFNGFKHPINLVIREDKDMDVEALELDSKALLDFIYLRPISQSETSKIFSKNTLEILHQLLNEGLIIVSDGFLTIKEK